MKALTPLILSSEMKWCSVPVPDIDAHKGDVFDFTATQISHYGQSQTHPSVIYIESGWNGHKWWMATTPYPNADGVFENPCVYYGDNDVDGNPPRIWTPISGASNGIYTVTNNPVVKLPSGSYVNSDPDLYFDQTGNGGAGVMYLISRENSNNFAVYAQYSIDGQSWTPRPDRATKYLWKKGIGECLTKPEFLSPAFVKNGSEILAYCLSGTAIIYNLNERKNRGLSFGVWIMKGTTLEDGGDFTYFKKASFLGKSLIEPWHFDICKNEATGYYYAVINSRNRLTGDLRETYLAESTDGYNFTLFSRPLIGLYTQYRPTAIILNGNLIVYYSTDSGAPTTPSSYPLGSSDVPIDGRAIGLVVKPLAEVLSKLKQDKVANII